MHALEQRLSVLFIARKSDLLSFSVVIASYVLFKSIPVIAGRWKDEK